MGHIDFAITVQGIQLFILVVVVIILILLNKKINKEFKEIQRVDAEQFDIFKNQVITLADRVEKLDAFRNIFSIQVEELQKKVQKLGGQVDSFKNGINQFKTTSQEQSSSLFKLEECGITLKEQTERLDQQVNCIAKQTEQIEAMTRETLLSFPEIFDKAMSMLKNCKSQFWMLSYTPVFGLVHTYDKQQLKLYWEMTPDVGSKLDYKIANDQLSKKVEKFTTKLKKKAAGSIDFRLATVPNGKILENFIDRVIQRMDDNMYDPAAKHEDGTNDTKRRIHSSVDIRHKDIINKIKSVCNEEDCRFKAGRGVTNMERIPIQLFISDKEDGTTNRKSCLVFFVNDANVEKDITISGFYTEQLPVVLLFESIFKDTVNSFNIGEN